MTWYMPESSEHQIAIHFLNLKLAIVHFFLLFLKNITQKAAELEELF